MMLKADFPIFTNNTGLVYLDSAATLQKSRMVIDGVKHYLENDYANVHRGWYGLSERSEDLYWQARKKTAALLHAEDDEIVFTASATDSVNKLVRSLMFSGKIGKGETVLLTELEHHANIVPWQIAAEEYGFIVDFVGVDHEHQIDLHDLEQKLHSGVKVFSCTMVSNVTGGVSDMHSIRDILHEQDHDILRCVDASQAIPHMHVDVQQLSMDVLYFTGHKLGAITGIGVLRGKRELLKLLMPARGGGGMIDEVTKSGYSVQGLPDKFEPGTPNLVGAISLKLAIEYLEHIGPENTIASGYARLDRIEAPLIAYCLEQFTGLENKGVRLLGPKDLSRRVGVFSFQLPPGKNATQLGQYMADHTICIRCGAQCAHIFHAGLTDTTGGKTCMQQTCRISLRGYNDMSDVEKFFHILRGFLQ